MTRQRTPPVRLPRALCLLRRGICRRQGQGVLRGDCQPRGPAPRRGLRLPDLPVEAGPPPESDDAHGQKFAVALRAVGALGPKLKPRWDVHSRGEKIGLVLPVKLSNPRLENDPAGPLALHHLRISPWPWFRNLAGKPRFFPSSRFSYRRLSVKQCVLQRNTCSIMPYTTGIRLLGIAQNPADGFPARLLAAAVAQTV